MKLTYLLLLLVFFSSCQSQEIYQEFHENGKLKFEVPLLNGKKEGLGKTYFDDGELKIEAQYKNDMLNGEYRQLYYGRTIKEVNYKDDKLDGYATYYSPTKLKTKEGTYLNGKMHGKWKIYTESGCLRFEYTYIQDIKEGPYKVFYCSGELETSAYWKDGLPMDLMVSFNKEGDTVGVGVWTIQDGVRTFLEDSALVSKGKPSFTVEEVDGKYYYWMNGVKTEGRKIE
jgi:antitoxin component YwqK of YwqJK toxin-antitoxin module